MGGEELKASASAPSANEPAKDLILVHTVQLKPMIKAQGCSIRFSVLGETRLKKLIMIIIIIFIMNRSLETMARKVMVDFKI